MLKTTTITVNNNNKRLIQKLSHLALDKFELGPITAMLPAPVGFNGSALLSFLIRVEDCQVYCALLIT